MSYSLLPPGGIYGGPAPGTLRSDDTNGASLSVTFYCQTTYDSTLAADLGIIQIFPKVHLAKNKGDSTV
jgi:hypothetical protein